ncbi:MAG: hypothetical protein ACRD9W_13525, partial [Terriglobia bacterium]
GCIHCARLALAKHVPGFSIVKKLGNGGPACGMTVATLTLHGSRLPLAGSADRLPIARQIVGGQLSRTHSERMRAKRKTKNKR